MTPWRITPTKEFTKSLRKLDRPVARQIVEALDAIAATGQPRSRGKALTGPLSGLWRYRIGNYRVLVELHDDELVILALKAGHRSTIYRDFQR